MKRPRRKSQGRKGYFKYYLVRYFISVCSVSVIVLVSLLFSKSSSLPCANSISCASSLKIENGAMGIFNGQKINPPKIDTTKDNLFTKVLGESDPAGEKHIYVDLTTQTLTAYQGDTQVLKTFISSGKWFPTPTGEFRIWSKLRATRMSGGEGDDFYDLPNVPYVMFFYNNEVSAGRGFSLHGAYWHNNFGYPMSHGCVNMRIVDAGELFNFADFDTKITITGQPPAYND